MREKELERTMSGNDIKKTIPAPKAVRPRAEREEAPVRWPSVASSGAGAYVSNPEPKGDAAGSETSAEG